MDSLQPPSPSGSHLSSIKRSPSHESLTAHPLLSPPHHSESLRTAGGAASTSSPPKYVPYTPRHRAPPTGSVTVSSPVSAAPPQQIHGGATSKLQLQNLKAVAQKYGLDAGTVGWAMLEEIVVGSDQSHAWNEIWSAITTGKATLLLPIEHLNSHEAISTEFLKDHIIFSNGTAKADSPFVTLSGLRGTINDNVSFRSTLATSSKSFTALQAHSTRSSALSSLPPLASLSAYAPPFPELSISDTIDALPLPPRNIVQQKPPLPPRPGTKPPSSAPTRSISNPFASFFKTSTPSSPSLPPTTDVPAVEHPVDISAFVIDHAVIRRTVAKALTKSFKTEIKVSLQGLPTGIVDKTQNFASELLPFPKQVNKGSKEASPSNNLPPPYSFSALEESAEDAEDRFQDFYQSLQDTFKAHTDSPSSLRKRESHAGHEDKGREEKMRDMLERIERILCCTFYDRLFRQSNSDDASHDEALSSRVAALNMLDLTLDHLGVDVGTSETEIEGIVVACGQTISQLQVAQCPADKAAILVAAHRIIVDGLSRLPPIRLKSDDAIEDDRTPVATKFDTNVQTSESAVTVKPSDLEKASSGDGIVSTEVEIEEKSMSVIDLPPSAAPSVVVDTPLLTVSPPPKNPTPVSGDILLPLLIFAVVKANPHQLVSHLLYTQRFRNRSVGGEESYCLVNLMAVVEFLENVDLGALGLKDSESKVMSTADLTPIPVAQTALASEKSDQHAGLRGRVEQQVDAIAGSANKVLSGVVDSGFGVLRALLPMQNSETSAEGVAPEAHSAPWNATRPGFGLLRRQSGFSIASLAASLPGRERTRSFASSFRGTEEAGQEMVESRPGSVRSMRMGPDDAVYSSEQSGAEEDGDGDDDADDDEEHADGGAQDVRSIRSFESMYSGKGAKNKSAKDKKDRMSLSDRLASMSRLTKGGATASHHPEISVHRGSPPPRTSSLQALQGGNNNRFESPISSRSVSPIKGDRVLQLAPPNRRFLECSADDLKMSEIPGLLAEYRRLAEGIRSVGGFEDITKL